MQQQPVAGMSDRAGIKINESASGEAAPLAANQLAVFLALCSVLAFQCVVTAYRRASPATESSKDGEPPILTAAEALAYLHSTASPPIIHGDVKPANILLDENYNAKVSDFGASVLAPSDEAHLVTLVQGTCGYLDPEYMQMCRLTDRSDVYSFGVVLLELLTRRKALSLAAPEEERSLAAHFLSSVRDGRLDALLDPGIRDEIGGEVLGMVAKLAKRCLEMSGDKRPPMREVAEEL